MVLKEFDTEDSMRLTKTMKNISTMYKGMHLDENLVFHKSKLVLAIYRDVVWASLKEVDSFHDLADEYYSHDLSSALTYLNDFAPTEKRQDFETKVSYLFETKWMIDLIDNALLKIYDYYNNGKLYHEILTKCYITSFPYTESELIDVFGIERSSFYERKKEAVNLFGVALWGYALPKYKGLFEDSKECDSIPAVFRFVTAKSAD
jgi:hypothetical protein